jgi:glutathione S-transferase
MSKPEIVGSIVSSYTRVIRMVCAEKAIDYTLTEVLLDAPELKALHPFGKMPVLRHGDLVLCESKAIATYLDLAFPGSRLIPTDPKLAGLTEQWVSLVNSVIDGTLVRTYLLAYAAPRTADGQPDRAIIDGVLPRVREQLGILDNAVSKTGFLAGGQFTLADINLMPILFYMTKMPESGEILAKSEHLSGYYARHSARPSFVTTEPPLRAPRRAG